MYGYIKKMEAALTEEDKRLFKAIYAPRAVTVPPRDASTGMCITPDGEIRIYGSTDKNEPDDLGKLVYISSKDCGLSWKTHECDPAALGSAGYNPTTGRYISHYPNEHRRDLKKTFGKSGSWAILNDEGFDSKNSRLVKLSDRSVHFLKLPFYLEDKGRWFLAGEYLDPETRFLQIILFYSDDDGETWTEKVIEKSAPKFEVKPPHKGTRWQQYSCEPTIVELSDGELVMFVRTSQNYHYSYRSRDNGETWEGPERTDFHGTITMPILHKLSDGRIVFFWCNSQPMPELDHTKAFPGIDDGVIRGFGEDVFTNRDANHLAISEDDMKTWRGFRELWLNAIRNNADYRSIGGLDSRDKSVHQAQILELPYNKLLVYFGQNAISRKVVILDVNWLYEKDRFENFRYGLEGITTHMFVESYLGGYRGFSGHCAYNRTNGALLVPDPDGNYEEVLQIARVEDERLVYKKQGAVWNFPASQKGRVEIRLRVLGCGVRISLTDHWYNAADETVADEAHVSFTVDEPCGWTDVTVDFDTEAGEARVTVGESSFTAAINESAPFGLSYLHIQTLAEKEDYSGTLIKTMRKTDLG